MIPATEKQTEILSTFNKPQNLRAETEKLERVTCRSRQGERGFSQKWTQVDRGSGSGQNYYDVHNEKIDAAYVRLFFVSSCK